MTDDDIRHAEDDDETAEEITVLISKTLDGLADSVRVRDLCPQCVLLEMLVQVAGVATVAGVTPGNIVAAVGEGLSALDDNEDVPGSSHLH
ncbi:MAG: hypothetical protein ACI9MJ_000402 [Alphaproteobacteria bacterium]|jgi:hypothetical protein